MRMCHCSGRDVAWSAVIAVAWLSVCGCLACGDSDHTVRESHRGHRRDRHAVTEPMDAAVSDAATDEVPDADSRPEPESKPDPKPHPAPAPVPESSAPTKPPTLSEPPITSEPSVDDDDDDAGTPAADSGAPDEPEGVPPPAASLPFFSTVWVEHAPSVPPLGDGDLWANCWSDDDALYVAAGDGTGFGLDALADIFVARIDGAPTSEDDMRGTTLSSGAAISSIWSGSDYNRKPTGMLCLDGDLYLAVQDLRLHTFSDAPAATITRSRDRGRTWTYERSAPMFDHHVFTTIMFLDYGRDAEHAPADYVYAYGLDNNWSFDTPLAPPTRLYLARIPRTALQDRSRWEFFRGYDGESQPRWTSDIAARAPVLEDTRRTYTTPLNPMQRFRNMTVINQGGVVYNAPLQRYLYASWTEYTFEFYEAPQPWGPWTHFFSTDVGITPWNSSRNGGYATTLPSKFISSDGTTMWLQANAWAATGADNYHFSLREVRVTKRAESEPTNTRSDRVLSTDSQGAVPIGRTFRYGASALLNDGITANQSEDSWSGEANAQDFWGYTWPRAFRINTLRYTAGRKTAEGGWFETLSVQARHGQDWTPVTGLRIDPAYANDSSVPDGTTYTLRFDEVVTDGVRLFGRPGGSGRFTSIAELAASYE